MTIRTLLRRRLPLLATLSLCLFVSGLSAQDAEKVNPKIVKLKLENEHVRVLETVSNPGDKELMHSHPANVVYVIEGAKLRVTTADGKTTEVELKTGDTIWREPVVHSAENIGTTRFHAIIFELKKP
ncbi:MAG TPA: cupin domain-containing protein [Thermoanaerobaculia bacterium]|nr:cupin domain-containing protein [Thermoanaerobaculia bacterium]